MMAQISVKDVTVTYHSQVALYQATLDINKGDVIGIIGENGSGKTTLLRAMLGLVPIREGTVQFEDGLQVGYVPQYISRQDFLFPATAEEVVLMGLLANKERFKFFTKEDKEIVKNTFQQLDIENLMKKRIGTLSGGQQQRVLLARALVNEPDVLLLDEPTSALDQGIQTSFLNILTDLNKRLGITVVIVTHDLASMGNYVDEVVYLETSIKFKGPFSSFCSNETLSPYIHNHGLEGCDPVD